MTQSSLERKQLIWMCRRGTRELDQMTRYYLDKHYDRADEKQRKTFRKMLQLSDPELQDVLIHGHSSEDADLDAIGDFIRQNYHG